MSYVIVWAVGLYFVFQLWKLFGEHIKTIYNFISGFNPKKNTKGKKTKKKKSAKDTIRESFEKDS